MLYGRRTKPLGLLGTTLAVIRVIGLLAVIAAIVGCSGDGPVPTSDKEPGGRPAINVPEAGGAQPQNPAKNGPK
jgi:hypothetical protein